MRGGRSKGSRHGDNRAPRNTVEPSPFLGIKEWLALPIRIVGVWPSSSRGDPAGPPSGGVSALVMLEFLRLW
jgi:hypothetical protein